MWFYFLTREGSSFFTCNQCAVKSWHYLKGGINFKDGLNSVHVCYKPWSTSTKQKENKKLLCWANSNRFFSGIANLKRSIMSWKLSLNKKLTKSPDIDIHMYRLSLYGKSPWCPLSKIPPVNTRLPPLESSWLIIPYLQFPYKIIPLMMGIPYQKFPCWQPFIL